MCEVCVCVLNTFNHSRFHNCVSDTLTMPPCCWRCLGYMGLLLQPTVSLWVMTLVLRILCHRIWTYFHSTVCCVGFYLSHIFSSTIVSIWWQFTVTRGVYTTDMKKYILCRLACIFQVLCPLIVMFWPQEPRFDFGWTEAQEGLMTWPTYKRCLHLSTCLLEGIKKKKKTRNDTMNHSPPP